MPLFRCIQIFEIPRRYIARITTLKFSRPSQTPRDTGIRATWEEAKLNIIAQLRLGIHPALLQLKLDSEHYAHTEWHQQDVDDFASKILMNLRRAGQFDDLPSLGEYQRKMEDDVWLARFELKMCEKFGERGLISQFGMDERMSQKLDGLRELNRDEQDWLAIMNVTKTREIDEKCQENEEILQRHQSSDARSRSRRPRSVSTTIHNSRTRNTRNDRSSRHSVDVPSQNRHSFSDQRPRQSRNPSPAVFSDSGLFSEASFDTSRPPSRRQTRGRRTSSSGLYPSQNQRGRPPASRPHLFDGIDDMAFGDTRRFSTPVSENWHLDKPLESGW